MHALTRFNSGFPPDQQHSFVRKINPVGLFSSLAFIRATRPLSLSTTAILFIVFLFHSSALLLSSPLPSYPPQTQDIAIHEAGD